MVLHHVAQRAGLLVVAGARPDAFLLGHGNLHVIHVFLVEQRLEDAVREAQHEDVLDGLFAEIVIDSVNLPLMEHLGERVVDLAGAREIVADRFLDDQARERLAIRGPDEPCALKVLDRRDEHRRRHGQIVDAVARQPALVLDGVEARAKRSKGARIVDRGVDEEQRLRERVPDGLVERPPREVRDPILGELTIGLI